MFGVFPWIIRTRCVPPMYVKAIEWARFRPVASIASTLAPAASSSSAHVLQLVLL